MLVKNKSCLERLSISSLRSRIWWYRIEKWRAVGSKYRTDIYKEAGRRGWVAGHRRAD